MPNELVTALTSPDPEDNAHEDGRLMHELSVVNTLIGRYVLRHSDADAGYDEPVSPANEHALADRVASAAEGIRARAIRRTEHEKP